MIALISGLIYILLAANKNSLCWIFGIVSCSIIAYEDFYIYRLYSDGLLQTFYVGMGVLGIYQWNTTQENKDDVRLLSVLQHVWFVAGSTALGLLLGWIMVHYTATQLPWTDAITTAFAITTTGLLVYRYHENWIYWIGINAVYIFIYGSQGAWFYAFLAVVYGVLSLYGLIKWRRVLI